MARRNSTDIRVDIEYEGVTEGADQLDRVVQRLTALERKERTAAQSTSAFAQAQTAVATTALRQGQRLEQLGSTIGQVGGVISRMNPELSRFGSAISNLGASIPALTGSLGPVAQVMAAVNVAVDIGSSLWELYEESTSTVPRNLEAIANAAKMARDELAGIERAMARQARQEAIASFRATEETIGAEIRDVERERARAAAQAMRARQELDQTRARLDELERQRVSTLDFDRLTAIRREQVEQERLLRRRERAVRATEQRVTEFQEREAQLRMQQLREIAADREAAEEEAEERAQQARARVHRRGVDARRREEERLRREEQEAMQRSLQEDIAFAAQRQEIEEQNARELARIQREMADFRHSLTEESLQFQLQAIERERDARIRAIEKEKEARAEALAQRRAESAEVASTLTQITQAVTGAFEAAISGEEALEDALKAATKQLLQQLGEQLIAKGIGHILDGIAELPSPTAAPKIAGGTAMVAFGVGLGAAGAAIPTAPATGAEAPREEPQSGGDGGPRTLVMNVNNPVMTASTHAQLARGLGRALEQDTTFAPGVRR